jgi:hypothetical protein
VSIDRLETAIATARDVVRSLEEVVDEREAARIVDMFAELERISTAGRTLAARRVEKSRLWMQQGYRTPAHWIASHTQTTVAAAVTTLETARRLEQLPATREAFKTGTLSQIQATEIARAASADPTAEESLLKAASAGSVAGLRDRCRSVIAAATRDDDADERLHRSRYLRHWSDPDGVVRLDARLTPDAGARLIATIQARSRAWLDQARRSGSRESREAYAADALVSLADQTTPGPRAIVHVYVAEAAWKRGRVDADETCQISGIGPASVSAARRLASDGVVKAVLADGADVRAVAHFGRTILARVRIALEARDQTCVVPGCDEREGMEIDHIVPLGQGGATKIENLARLCRWHHGLKTHRGWVLAGEPGNWRFFKPRRAATRSPPA